MTIDLALIAERRCGLAALLGLLLLEEPGPDLGPLVAGVEWLAPLVAGDSGAASEYEAVFLRGVPLYESIFRNDDGQHGQHTLADLVQRYEQLDFNEHTERRWRIAGPDHLGMELRCLAHLCRLEAVAWRSGTPDEALAAVERERSFLADHLSRWAPMALNAALTCARADIYRPVLHAVGEFLDEEFDRLRPAPDLGEMLQLETLPHHIGPARLARLLLSPATCGTWISTAEICQASHAIGVPWRASDTRSALRQVIEAAHDTGELPLVLQPMIDELARAIAHHKSAAATSPGNAANALRWALTADAMRDKLLEISASGLRRSPNELPSETLTVSGADPQSLADAVDKLVAELREQGFDVQRHPRTPSDSQAERYMMETPSSATSETPACIP